MSTHRQPGRRRAPGRIRRFPDGFPRTGASWAVKSVASLGVVGGAAVALTIPAESADAEADVPAQVAVANASTMAIAQRGVPEVASRSQARAAAPAPAVSAPTDAAPLLPETVGVEGVKAVAKPKPKPKPKPVPTPTETPEAVTTEEAVPAAPPEPAAPAGWDGNLTGRCTTIGLIPNAQRMCSAVDEAYGPPTIGGRRASNDEHGTGQAVDFMIADASQGDAIAAYVQAHVGDFNVKYLIWQQRYWAPGEGWRMMEDRGSITANHYDHVHVTMNF